MNQLSFSMFSQSLLLITSLIGVSTGVENAIRYERLSPGRRMTAHQMSMGSWQHGTSTSRSACAKSCTMLAGCNSFAYSYTSQQCELYEGFSMENFGNNMMNSAQWDHYDLDCYCNDTDAPFVADSHLSMSGQIHCGQRLSYQCDWYYWRESGSPTLTCDRQAQMVPLNLPVCAPCPNCTIPVAHPNTFKSVREYLCNPGHGHRNRNVKYLCLYADYIQVDGIANWQCDYWTATWHPSNLIDETQADPNSEITTNLPHCEYACPVHADTTALNSIGQGGELVSPNWPNLAAQQPSLACRYVFIGQPNTAVEFTANLPFGIKRHWKTSNGVCGQNGMGWKESVSFYDGSETKDTLFGRWCHNNSVKANPVVTSRTNNVVVIVDYGLNRIEDVYMPGFNITYISVNASYFDDSQLSSEPCGGEQRAVPDLTPPAYFNMTSPGYPENYPNKVICGWRMNVQPGTMMTLLFGRPFYMTDMDKVSIYRFGSAAKAYTVEGHLPNSNKLLFSGADPRPVIITFESNALVEKNLNETEDENGTVLWSFHYDRYPVRPGFLITALVCPSGWFNPPDCNFPCPAGCPANCGGYNGLCP